MDRTDVDWHGYWPACPTPFREDGSLDLDEHRALVDAYIDMGVHGILINGTCGEWFAQSDDERRQVAEAVLGHVAGRVPVVVGCTAYTAVEAAELGRHALAHGASGIASTPPPYSKPMDDEVVAYYEELSELVDGPIMAYNWPHGTSVDMSTELASRVVDVANVVALKDSTPDADKFFETAAAVVDRVRVFGPFMSVRGLEALATQGGDGTIGGGCLWGRPDPQFWEDHWRGDDDAARAHAERIDELFLKLWLPGGWAGVVGAYQSQLKVLMAMLGQPGGTTVRRPRLPVTDPDDLARLRGVLVEAGMLDQAATTTGAAA